MDKNTDEAQKFVAVAHFPGERDREGISEGVTLKTITLSPDSTIAEVVSAFWPSDKEDDLLNKMFFTPPFRIEILPCEKAFNAYKMDLGISSD